MQPHLVRGRVGHACNPSWSCFRIAAGTLLNVDRSTHDGAETRDGMNLPFCAGRIDIDVPIDRELAYSEGRRCASASPAAAAPPAASPAPRGPAHGTRR